MIPRHVVTLTTRRFSYHDPVLPSLSLAVDVVAGYPDSEPQVETFHHILPGMPRNARQVRALASFLAGVADAMEGGAT